MNYFSKLKIKGFTPTPKSLVSGFTLTELIVVITIATIITTALVFQQAKWNDNLAVSTQAYDLALMIRQAQIYSLGVKEDNSATGDKFNIGYGIYFTQNNLIFNLF
jgi:prepilin-type N-terminal cleavage/methylation domain-containing protein